MNLWIRYGPLLYTYYSRINCELDNDLSKDSKLSNIIYYMRNQLSIGLRCLLVCCLFGVISYHTAIKFGLLYVYIYIVYNIFYEIGYIHNDIFAIKKEKKGTYRISNLKNDSFRRKQILIRIFFGSVCLVPIYLYAKNIFIQFLFIIFVMIFVFFIHNTIRNYKINMYTFAILRILKMLTFILIIYNLPIATYIIYEIIEATLVFRIMYFFSERHFYYNKKLGGSNVKDLYLLARFLIVIFCILFYIVLGNIFFIVIPIIPLIPSILNFTCNLKKVK